MKTLISRISIFAFIVYASLTLAAFGAAVSALAAITGAPAAA